MTPPPIGFTLPIVENFHSIQGEGSHAGRSAYFIRLASCKVGCPWCDTKESWSSRSYPLETVDNLAQKVYKAHLNGAGFLVITGGEPLHHNLNPLCIAIKNLTSSIDGTPIRIHLETSGVDEITGSYDWITLSPKRHMPPKNEILKACNEIKVIVHKKEDLLFAEEMAQLSISQKKGGFNSKDYTSSSILEPILYLQPGWNHKEGQELAIDYVQKHPKWRLSLQTHKWLKIE